MIFFDVSLPVVIFGALADSFNPCAWSALIFLVTTLLSIQASRKKMLKIGITYITTIFSCYLLIGIGLFSFLQYAPTGWSRVLYGILGVIVLIAAAIELKDVFWYGKGISLKIPEKSWGKIKSFMIKSTVPATITVAALISILEFGCTGGVYLPIIAMLSSDIAQNALLGVIYLIIYNFIFVLPLIIILGLVVNGYAYKKIEEFRKHNRKLMRLISGLVMLALGVWLLLQV
ncbi:hypothetical protein GF357_00835 [Candidatus Dojkabacteria bacterium]|nr:hypothetical protein [Candidatus Dojkabacteria bacterium]